MGQQKVGKVNITKSKQMDEHFLTRLIHRQLISDMIGYKRSILERQNFSDVGVRQAAVNVSNM